MTLCGLHFSRATAEAVHDAAQSILLTTSQEVWINKKQSDIPENNTRSVNWRAEQTKSNTQMLSTKLVVEM